MGIVQNILDRIYKREINKSDFASYFKRIDFDNFFKNLSYYIDPEELMLKIGDRRVLKKLYYDGEIFAAVDKRVTALASTKLVLDGPDESIVKFMEEQILPFERKLKQYIWWAVPYGYSVIQIMYNEDRSGRVVGFEQEDFYRFEPMVDGVHVRLNYSNNPELNGHILDYGKFVLTVNNGSKTNPKGDAMFTRLYLPWLFKCNADDLWMRFLERYALGFLIGKTPDGEDVDDLLKTLEAAAKGAAVAVTTQDDVQYLQPARDSSMFTAINDKTNNLFYRVILGETQTSNLTGTGSYASASIHNEIRLEKTLNDINLVENGIEEVMRQIAAVNGIDPALVPTANLIYDKGLESDRAARDATLASTGQVQFTKKYFTSQYGFEEDEIEIVEPVQNTSPFGFSKEKKKSSFLSKEDIKTFLGASKEECKDCGN